MINRICHAVGVKSAFAMHEARKRPGEWALQTPILDIHMANVDDADSIINRICNAVGVKSAFAMHEARKRPREWALQTLCLGIHMANVDERYVFR